MNHPSNGPEHAEPEPASWGFWHAQAAVWALLVVIGFCIRLAFFGNATAAFWLTLLLDSAAFALTSAAAVVHRRWSSGKPPFAFMVACAVLLCVAAAALLSSLGYAIHQLFPPGMVRPVSDDQYRVGFVYYMAILSIWTLTYFGVSAQLAARNERIAKMKAENRAVRMELEHLRKQIEPHFLFNALNAVVAEIGDRPAIAEEMTRRLADYLRYSLDRSGRGTSRVDEEIEAAETYIRIQAMRFDRQLEYRSQVDPAALAFRIPHMTLQGLVENAIKHGLRAEQACFLINIGVSCKDGELVVEVDNPGRLSAPGDFEQGSGLSNLCRRLALYYPDRHDFSLTQSGGRTVARLRLRGDPAAMAA